MCWYVDRSSYMSNRKIRMTQSLNGKDWQISGECSLLGLAVDPWHIDVQYYDADEPTVDENGNPVYEDDGVTQKKGMDIKYTTPNLKGADAVLLDNAGMFGLRVENSQLMLYVNIPDSTTGDIDDIAPPFSLEGNTLYYTVNGKIQYVSKQTI